MAKARGDDRTLDLLDWESPVPVVRHRPEMVRAQSLRGRLSRAVSVTLNECGRDRGEVAAEMGQLLGAPVPLNMLNAYASQARRTHAISLERLWALCSVTEDWRPMSVLIDGSDLVIIERRYLGAVKEAMAQAEIERLERVRRAARRQWKGGRS